LIWYWVLIEIERGFFMFIANALSQKVCFTLVLFIGLFFSLASYADNTVKLKAVESFSYDSSFPIDVRCFDVDVKNLSFEKRVSIWGQRANGGNWGELEGQSLAYVGTYPQTDIELWRGCVYRLRYANPETWGDQFVVKVEMNGSVYWDNNQTSNYHVGLNDGMFFNANQIIRLSKIQVRRYSNDYASFAGVATLKRVDGFNPQVNICFSQDGWASYNDAYLYQSKGFMYSELANVPSPNQHGIEYWSFYASIDPSKPVEYALVYTDGSGRQYWDNNLGRNYLWQP